MTENEIRVIRCARQFLINHEDQRALDCYLEVNKQNEDNAEAAYWVYTAYWRDCVNNNASGHDKWVAFTVLSNELVGAVEEIAQSDCSEAEKMLLLAVFVSVYTPIADYITGSLGAQMATPKDRIERVVLTLYRTGNAIERFCNGDPDIMKVAAKAWKEGVKLQQKFYAYSYNDNKVEDYIEKIKKVEPSYVAPKKAGCISLG